MPKSSRILSVVSFLVYGAVVLVLIYLAIYARGFSERLSDVRFSGRYTPLPLLSSKKIQDLTVSYRGLDLMFSRLRPLALRRPDGTVESYEIDTLVSHSYGADILYGGGVKLHVSTAEAEDSSHALTVELPRGLTGTVSLVIPFRVKGAAKSTRDVPMLSWGDAGDACILSLSEGSRIDFESGLLVMETLQEENRANIRFGRGGASAMNPYASWLSQEAALATPEAFQKELDAFSRDAYEGWSKSRLSSDGGLWREAGGSYAFREEIGRSLLAEALYRGTYQRQRALFQDALAGELRRFPDRQFSLSSSAYTGNLREYVRRLQMREPGTVEQWKRRIAAPDVSLFAQASELIPSILDHGPFSLVEDAFALLQDWDKNGQGDVGTGIGVAEALLDYAALVGNAEAALAQCRGILERRILPAVKKTDKGILLESGVPGRMDIAATLRAARLFIRAGADLKLPVVGSIGRSLAVSALGLRDESGFLPAAVGLSLDSVVSRDGSIAPEDVYPEIAENRYLAAEIPLYKSLGPGSWIWTAAKLAGVQATQQTLGLSLVFPVGLPHYLVIQGVKQFSRLTLHDIPWRPDPDYPRYADGYWYDPQGRTLYMKLTGRVEKEEILIQY